MSISKFVRRVLGLKPAPRQPGKRRSLVPFLERLEERNCPALTWEWASIGAMGGDTSWSNPNGKDWKVGGAYQAAGKYPGQADDDEVDFNDPLTKSATLDVPLPKHINKLSITNWRDTLTLNNDLIVSGGGGVFVLSDSSTISLAPATTLWLTNLGPSSWSDGIITGAAATSLFIVNGTALSTAIPMGATSIPGGLSVNMIIQGAGINTGSFTIINASGNLYLTGTDNIIEVATGGALNLSEQIPVAGQQNTKGGIALDAAHTGTLAVQVDAGGILRRSDSIGSTPGIVDQVNIDGAVYNLGGTVLVDSNNSGNDVMLYISGNDVANYSYWQKTGVNGLLSVTAGANLKAKATYQIDIGTVELTPPAGGNAADELDGAGLNFGNAVATKLTFVDLWAPMGVPGTVTVQGPVTLAAKTTTTLNYNGGNNTADLLDVKNGALTLAGTLKLMSNGSGKPTQPLNFLDDSGAAPAMVGAFASITGDIVGAMYASRKVVQNGQPTYYEVTIT